MSLESSSPANLPSTTAYDSSQVIGMAAVSVAGGISLLAILIWAVMMPRQSKAYHHTHIFAYYVSLIVANGIQATGTVMNFKWVGLGYVISGNFCTAQGGIKHGGNIATALWSFMIALHLFNLLFLRLEQTLVGLVASLIAGWCAIAAIICAGPEVIQSGSKGQYYGVSHFWCWITNNYPKEQFFLEYFFEFMSAGIGFLLYIFVLLRVRGNLVIQDEQWHLRFVSSRESWRLQVGRDVIDTSMMRVAAHMVWYPVAYSIILIPVSLARLFEFAGRKVPFWALATTDVMYSTIGLINVCLLLATRRLLPEPNTIPSYSTPRTYVEAESTEAMGYTPYFLPPKDEEEKASDRYDVSKDQLSRDIAYPEQSHPGHKRQGSQESQASHYSEGSQGRQSRFPNPHQSQFDTGDLLSDYYSGNRESMHPDRESRYPDRESKYPDRESRYLDTESIHPDRESRYPDQETRDPDRESHYHRDSLASLSSAQSDELRDYWDEFTNSGGDGRASQYHA